MTNNTNQHHTINAAEFGVRDLATTRAFFEQAFDLTFTAYGGGAYLDAVCGGVTLGFYELEPTLKDDTDAAPKKGPALLPGLLIFYSCDLEQSQAQIQSAGGQIVQDTFAFPGGKRFHFCEPSGHEFAVWSDR